MLLSVKGKLYFQLHLDTVAAIVKRNNLRNAEALQPGQTLQILTRQKRGSGPTGATNRTDRPKPWDKRRIRAAKSIRQQIVLV